VAVAARQEKVDPVGSCVGVRGVRIQNIVNELYGEKIDVIEWSPDLPTFISNALSPAKPISVSLNEDEKVARVIVPTEQMSLAIGKDGQNARLAYKLTGWRIDIKDPEALRSSGDDDILRRAREALASGPDDMIGLGRQPRLVHADGMINVREKEFGPLTPDLVNMSVDVEVENGVLNVYYNRDLRARFDYETGAEISVTEDESSQVGSERPA
jgi:N utilization substance protein A